ncbi:MAG: Crp/Fnr family transcriptional regulator [Nitrospirae bacterium]|nr:MAG: Crp/Fnr family transcriptional regulator [Nitrospirota bacterium]
MASDRRLLSDYMPGIPDPLTLHTPVCHHCTSSQTCPFRTLIERVGLHESGFISSKVYPQGSIIFSEGEPISALHLVCAGLVLVTKLNPHGQEAVMHVIPPGGILNLSDHARSGRTYTCSAEALVETTIAFFQPAQILGHMRRDVSFAMGMFDIAVAQLKDLEDRFVAYQHQDVKNRIIRFLAFLVRYFAVSPDDKGRITIPFKLRRPVLARAVGTTTETVSRIMGKLARMQLIKEQPDALVVVNLDKLQALAGSRRTSQWGEASSPPGRIKP